MALEVEAKARCTDPELIVHRLESMGAVFCGTCEQSDTYFRHPCRDYSRTDEAIRMRRESGRIIVDGEAGTSGGTAAPGPAAVRSCITYKGPKVDPATKTRVEIESAVADTEGMRSILEALGFIPVLEVDKTRRRFRLADVEISVDEVRGLGDFVEVEYVGHLDGDGMPGDDAGRVGSGSLEPENDLGRARERVLGLLRELGLNETVRKSYLELLLEAKGAPPAARPRAR